MIPKILIVDDEQHMRWALEKAMKQEGYNTISASNGRRGLQLIKDETISLVLLDLRMPEMDGMEVLKQAKEIVPKLPIIILTAHGTIETAIEAMKNGAVDYITKPFDLDELKLTIKKALVISQLYTEVNFLRSELTREHEQMIGKSLAVKEVQELIKRVAPTNVTVLLTGESGTGKEVAAVAIHYHSSRRNKPFIKINCAALPENLLESELFGHEKGAFTGAVARKLGRFELANNGTIFLDEIGEIPLSMQAKLLRVLQDKTFERIGGTETLKADVRVVAATNRELRQAIDKGTFREDLYYRLNVIPIHLPPLRMRSEDIPLLVEHFLRKIYPGDIAEKISPETMKILCSYAWPGNIRELQNVIERAVIISREQPITPRYLPPELQNNVQVPVDSIIHLPEQGIPLEEVEKTLIIKALDKTDGNQTKAAKLLGITRSALLYRAEKYGII